MAIAIRRPSSLDPAEVRDPGGTLIVRQVFDTLVGFDPETGELRPSLAASWRVLDGGSRFVFRLRRGARFHNGRAVAADDVVFSLNRLARKDTASDLAFLLSDVAGFEAVNAGSETELEGLRATDGRTVEVRLSSPWYDFPYVLTSPATAAIPRGEYEADPAAFRRRPLGSGPYALARPVISEQDIVLVRYPGYRGRRPQIRRVSFLVYERSDAAWRDFGEGKVDVAEVPPAEIDAARARYGAEGFAPLAAGVYLGLNLRSPKFADRRLRQAISLSIDRQLIAREIYGGVLVAAGGIIPRGLPGRSELACGGLCEHDPARARELLDEAFGGAVPDVVLDHPAGPPHDAAAEAIRRGLGEVGVEVGLRAHELPAFIELVESSGQEMFHLGWIAEYPLAEWFLNPLFYSRSSYNRTGFSVPEVDELLARVRSSPERRKRLRLSREIEKLVTTDMVVIPIGHFRSHLAAAPRIDGFYVDQMGGFDVGRLAIDAR